MPGETSIASARECDQVEPYAAPPNRIPLWRLLHVALACDPRQGAVPRTGRLCRRCASVVRLLPLLRSQQFPRVRVEGALASFFLGLGHVCAARDAVEVIHRRYE